MSVEGAIISVKSQLYRKARIVREEIRNILVELAEASYREFASSLIPESQDLLGVRLPVLRRLAEKIVKEMNWQEEVCSFQGIYEDIYFEEVMLRGMVIGYGTKDDNTPNALHLLRGFIPYINNWSVCDSFCTGFTYAAKNREMVWLFLQPYLYSEKEFEVRVALILLLNHFLKLDKNGVKRERKKVITMEDVERNAGVENIQNYPYLERILAVLNREYRQGYYAQMAAAWTASEAFIAFPYETMQMLKENCRMDSWTYQKTLQKIRESKNPDAGVKQYLKEMKHCFSE